MSMVRFDPFREIEQFANGWATEPAWRARWAAMDAFKSGDAYQVRLDLPGIDEDSLDVTAENNTLTVRARRDVDAPKGAEFVARERPVGTFTRQMVLGDGLDVEKVSADYRNGVLTVTIPVAEHAKPRRIPIARPAGGNRKVIESG
ncbi:18 kDa antigen (HSP 16.7) [Actinocatenispora thailandica]|uniref:18 kDa antigen (HSP 16.7) n=2 Tax=Actinocatenispora thailandica TaxID=227318 RepID=A0A7R7HWB1_9ACTN|nr:18 kDa antigen (HSP 16.7) [Actinocatenispora thailandica]